MKNKTTWTILSILLVAFITLIVFKSVNEDSWMCTESGWVAHGKPCSDKPTTPCNKIDEKWVVENYLRENISNISPTKEVLGGKFYVNKIDWVGDNSGIVEYEDGHILLKATFDYEIQTDVNNNYSVIIKNFHITE